MLAELRLYQLISPSLPVGGFTYSQGLEWAIEHGWVHNVKSFSDWLESQLTESLASLELPVLIRLQQALSVDDIDSAKSWCDYLVASRETKEMRLEEKQRGLAFARLLPKLAFSLTDTQQHLVESTQLAAFALAMNKWSIPLDKLLSGYLWSWLDNAVVVGIKLVPLGQSDGQQLLMKVAERIPEAVAYALAVKDQDIGSFTPAQVLASCKHEHQYTRLFRS